MMPLQIFITPGVFFVVVVIFFFINKPFALLYYACFEHLLCARKWVRHSYKGHSMNQIESLFWSYQARPGHRHDLPQCHEISTITALPMKCHGDINGLLSGEQSKASQSGGIEQALKNSQGLAKQEAGVRWKSRQREREGKCLECLKAKACFSPSGILDVKWVRIMVEWDGNERLRLGKEGVTCQGKHLGVHPVG